MVNARFHGRTKIPNFLVFAFSFGMAAMHLTPMHPEVTCMKS
jgi:hypothetical protein